MTLEQMDKVIQSYCEVTGELTDILCDGCRIKRLCDAADGEFDKHPEILKQAYEIISNINENGCEACAFEDCDIDDYPCTHCKCNTARSEPNYELTPCLWMPKTPERKVPVIETEMVTDDNPVTHPSHYTQGNIECIDAMVSAFGKEATAHFCHLNAFKYLWRTEHKNGLQDIDKAIWYLNKFKELKSCG